MQFRSSHKPDKQDCYYLLPDSESPAAKEGQRRHEELWHKQASEVAPQKHTDLPGVSLQRKKPRFNKYALTGAILASTNSILLGYGEFCSVSVALIL